MTQSNMARQGQTKQVSDEICQGEVDFSFCIIMEIRQAGTFTLLCQLLDRKTEKHNLQKTWKDFLTDTKNGISRKGAGTFREIYSCFWFKRFFVVFPNYKEFLQFHYFDSTKKGFMACTSPGRASNWIITLTRIKRIKSDIVKKPLKHIYIHRGS